MAAKNAASTGDPSGIDVSFAPGARSGERRKTAAVERRAPRGRDARTSRSRLDLAADLRDFIGVHPSGWAHEDWLTLLEELRARGHDIDDSDAIGAMLERERLSVALESVDGMGARRIRSLSERFGTLWNLRQAPVEELVGSCRIPRPLAERIRSAV
jgi:hypothetical protein